MIHGKQLDPKTRRQGRDELQIQLRVDEKSGVAGRQAASSRDMLLGPGEILGRAAQLYHRSTRPDAAGTMRPIARREGSKLVLPAGSIVLTGTPGGTAVQVPVGLDRARLIVMAGLSMDRARHKYARHCAQSRDEMGYLKPGDTVESVIQHLGVQRWQVVR